MKPSSLLSARLSSAAALFLLSLAHAGPPAEPEPPAQKVVLVDPNDPTTAAQPSARPRAAVDPQKVEKGLRMYTDFCQKCHGIDMVSPGGGFFDLRTFPHDDRDRFVRSVAEGKRAMPAWGSVLSPTDIDALWAYVLSGATP